MEAEYFPPKEDVILQSEAQTDLYILVSGSVVIIKFPNFIFFNFLIFIIYNIK